MNVKIFRGEKSIKLNIVTTFNRTILTGMPMIRQFAASFVIFFMATANGPGQDHAPPVIRSVSVDTGQNQVSVVWEPAVAEGIKRYVIYQGRQGSEPLAADPVDSVDISTTSYIHRNSEAYTRSVPYTVAAVYPDDISPLADYHHTIYTSAQYDSCEGSLLINWTPYVGWDENLYAYNVYIRMNSDDYLKIPSFPTDTFQYLHNDVTANALYSIFVEAENKNFLTSTSNTCRIFTTRALAPDFINADYATVTQDGDIALAFTVESGSQLNNFELYTGTDSDAVVIRIADIDNQTSGNIYYTHEVFRTNQPFYYRLAAVDFCPERNPVIYSNIASNIVLTASLETLSVQLAWTPYNTWLGEVDTYYLKRILNDESVTVIDSFSSGVRTAIDNIALLISESQQVSDKICYTITAVEGPGNPYGVRGSSQSNMACITVSPKIYMPNAFTPDANGINDEIKPKLTFRPKEYLFLVTDRWGSRVFETTDPDMAWKGDIMGGKKAPEGIYVYYLKITTSAGLIFEKRGHITLFYP